VDAGAAYELPVRGRHFAIDERGIGLRATWRLDRGFVNLSLWRDDICVETFHLTPGQAGRLVGFLVSGLADAVPDPGHGHPAGVTPLVGRQPQHDGIATRQPSSLTSLRHHLAEVIDRAATRLRP